jgi:hypothetical protein
VKSIALSFRYEKFGDKVATAGWTAEIDLPGIGKAVETTRITHTEVGGFHVPERDESSTTSPRGPLGSRTIEITDWKFNDDAE